MNKIKVPKAHAQTNHSFRRRSSSFVAKLIKSKGKKEKTRSLVPQDLSQFLSICSLLVFFPFILVVSRSLCGGAKMFLHRFLWQQVSFSFPHVQKEKGKKFPFFSPSQDNARRRQEGESHDLGVVRVAIATWKRTRSSLVFPLSSFYLLSPISFNLCPKFPSDRLGVRKRSDEGRAQRRGTEN